MAQPLHLDLFPRGDRLAARVTRLTRRCEASFAYDAFGRRKSKTIGRTTTAFLYDGLNPIQELSGGTPTANVLTGFGFDQLFTRTTSAGARQFLTDGLGSTLALSDGTGAIQTQYSYEPFGNTTTSGPANDNSYQYTGRENDGTGLYYYRARYYNPVWQRFVSEDPIGLRGGADLYAYVNNDPLDIVDPSGTTLQSHPQQAQQIQNRYYNRRRVEIAAYFGFLLGAGFGLFVELSPPETLIFGLTSAVVFAYLADYAERTNPTGQVPYFPGPRPFF